MSSVSDKPDITTLNKPKVLNCAICLEDIESGVQFLPCIHPFHEDCINGWIREQPVCPICKVPVYINTLDQLDRYNHHKSHSDRIAEEEAKFFHRVSAGAYDVRMPDDHDRRGAISNGIDNRTASLVNMITRLMPMHPHDPRDVDPRDLNQPIRSIDEFMAIVDNDISLLNRNRPDIRSIEEFMAMVDRDMSRSNNHADDHKHADQINNAVNGENGMNSNYRDISDLDDSDDDGMPDLMPVGDDYPAPPIPPELYRGYEVNQISGNLNIINNRPAEDVVLSHVRRLVSRGNVPQVNIPYGNRTINIHAEDVEPIIRTHPDIPQITDILPEATPSLQMIANIPPFIGPENAPNIEDSDDGSFAQDASGSNSWSDGMD
jgi:hypothetical protein